MLDETNVTYHYREYREEPLSEEEIRDVLAKLGLPAAALLRKADRAAKELGLAGGEEDSELIPLMAEHPTLLQRPIAVLGDRAVVGRPPEKILELLR